MHRTPRTVLALLLAAALSLTACGAADDTSSEATDAQSAATDEAAFDEGRIVEHDQGETELQGQPERVVTLDSPHLDAALTLDVTPVGAVRSSVDDGLPAYLGDRTDDIEVVGTIEEPDLEAIAALEPDLILSATVRHEAIYDELSAIAPTVFSASSGGGWLDTVELIGDALGRSDQAESELADYDERIEQVGEQVDAEGRTASVVRFLPGETRIYGPETFSGTVLTDLGFDLPDLEYDEYSMHLISAERIGDADADVLFATTYGEEADTSRGEVTDLWDTLDAVATGCQFDVDDRVWMVGIGLIGADLVLDDVEEFLTDADC